MTGKTAPFSDAAGEAAWRTAVERVLKGSRFDAVMTSVTSDRIPIEPLYPKADPVVPQPWRQAGRVGVVQRVDHPDPAAANALARADLEGGADGLAIVLEGAAGARGFGVRAGDATALNALLAGIDPTLIAIALEAPSATAPVAAEALAAALERRRHEPTALNIDFGLGAGEAVTALALRRRGFAGPSLRADGRPFHEAGATEAQELASLLAAGAAGLRAFEAAGATATEMGDAVTFVAVADTDLFLTIAKLRALRRLWACVEAACGLEPRPLRLQADTAWRAMTRQDPWTNLLRGSVGAAAAILGGADSLTVIPFTAPLGLPDLLARRLARNTGHVLIEESHLGRIADPAGGAGVFEALTSALCDKAWTAFQAIEAAGGFPAALHSGFWPAEIAASRAARQGEVASRKRPILGTSLYPAAETVVPAVLIDAPPGPAPQAEGLPSVRDAAALERDGAWADEGRR